MKRLICILLLLTLPLPALASDAPPHVFYGWVSDQNTESNRVLVLTGSDDTFWAQLPESAPPANTLAGQGVRVTLATTPEGYVQEGDVLEATSVELMPCAVGTISESASDFIQLDAYGDGDAADLRLSLTADTVVNRGDPLVPGTQVAVVYDQATLCAMALVVTYG